jgi:hypothetical protein
MFRVCESCGEWNVQIVVSLDGAAVCATVAISARSFGFHSFRPPVQAAP